MKKRISFLFLAVTACIFCSGCYLFTPLSRIPKPANFHYLWTEEADGQVVPLQLNPKNIYGMGLTYAAHLRETGSKFDPDKPPPVFKKARISLNQSGAPVKMPTRHDIISCAETIERGLGERVDKEFKELISLLDYEGELAFVLLENIDWGKIESPDYAPRLGYFIANDISARTIAVLGEGKLNRYEYWGASKSFPGFLPVGSEMWIPDEHKAGSILSVTITTTVNGKLRQEQSTKDMMYTPREMLAFISMRYPDDLPQKGDIVLTGTPGGVAMQVPAWKTWLADVLDLSRFTKLFFSIVAGRKNEKFLKPGNEVIVSADILGSVRTRIIE